MKSLNKVQVKKLNSFKYTSTKIRYLNSLNFTPTQIKNELNIIYQFVNNILKIKVKQPKETF